MTPLHRRAEALLTELARIDCLLVQGYTGAAMAARHRAAREEAEAILRDAGAIPGTAVRAHWLDQDTQDAPGVVSLQAERTRRAGRTTLATLAMLAGLGGAAQAQAQAQGYVGGFAGAMLMDSTVFAGGVKMIDQGGDAWMAGLRAGYGHRWPSGLYLGAEAEGWWGYGRSRALVNGDLYNLSIRGGAGAYARVGWQMTGGALGYARLGAQAILTNQTTVVAPSVGLGAEIPFAGPWHARVDLTYTRSTERLYREFYQLTAGIGWRW